MNFFDIPLRVRPTYHYTKEFEIGQLEYDFEGTRNLTLMTVESGSGHFKFEGKNYDLKKGVLYIFNKPDSIKIKVDQKIKSFWAKVGIFIFHRIELFDVLKNRVTYPIENPDKYIEVFKGLVGTEIVDSKKSLRKMGLIYQLLAPIEVHNGHDLTDSFQNFKRFGPVFEYIDHHFSEKIRILELAKILHISESYFAKQFSKTFNKTPLQYINQRRIEEAKILLTTTNYTLSRIASSVGFRDASHLTKIFKEHFDKSPKQFYKKVIAGNL